MPVADVLSTPVYGETLTVRHVASAATGGVAADVARVQTAHGWTATVHPLVAPPTGTADAVVLWGLAAGALRGSVGEAPTVVVLDEADVRTVLTQPQVWLREARAAHDTNLLLLPEQCAERFTRFGPPVPLAHRPAGLPAEDAVALLSAWVARAYAYGRGT